MRKPTHINVGLLSALGAFLLNPAFSLFFPYFIFFSLLPDLDHPNSILTKKLGAKLPFKHRGFTHTLLFVLIVQGIINFASWYFFGTILTKTDNIIVFILLNSHVLADLFTVSGIPYLWPLTNINFKIPIATTGNLTEAGFSLLVSGLNGVLLWRIFSSKAYEKLIPSQDIKTALINHSGFLWFLVIALLVLVVYVMSSEIRRYGKMAVSVVKESFKFALRTVVIFAIAIVSLFALKSLAAFGPGLSPEAVLVSALSALGLSVYFGRNYLLPLADSSAYLLSLSATCATLWLAIY